MKILQIGAGGIGSFLAREVVECVAQDQIDAMIDYTIADDDIVEMEQITYQNFRPDEAGMNKATALAKRLKVSLLLQSTGVEWINASKKKIEKASQLKGYDIIILCVDNDVTRRLVIEYCWKYNKQFLDLRAQGRNVFAMPKATTLKENMLFTSTDKKTYSCQEQIDLQKGYIQKGNKIAAVCGIQMLLNLLRGQSNYKLNWVI